MILAWMLLLLLLASPLVVLLQRAPGPTRSLALAAPAAGALGIFLYSGWQLLHHGEVTAWRVDWVPQLDLNFALSLNGVGLVLGLMVTGIGTAILAYAAGYLGKKPEGVRLMGFLYLFMFAMAGIAVSDHLLLLFVFWELTSISSYLLIGHFHEQAQSRRNALQALLVTGLGGMALLAGFILLANVSGTWYLSELRATKELVLASPLYPGILTLILLGAFTKSAQFPFHFWLPNAMVAPTPVSAYLHSATMVKAGVFLLFLMLPIIGGTQAWTLALTIAGGITLLLGASNGLRAHDLKAILAGTTMAVLGLLTLLIGIGTEKAVFAALLFMLGHALYKAALFMVAGAVDHEAGTRDTALLGGLRKSMPLTATAGLLAAFSMMGLPLFLGFLGKEYAYKAGLGGENSAVLTTVLVLGNAMMFALAAKAGILPFWKRAPQTPLPKHPHEAPLSMTTGPLVLAGLGIVFGAAPFLLNGLIAVAQSFSLNAETPASIKLWQGFNLPLLLSGVTIAAGLSILFLPVLVGKVLALLKFPKADGVYDKVLALILWVSNVQTRLLQSGYLRNYLLIIVVATAGLIFFKLARFGLPELALRQPVPPTAAFICVIMLAAIYLAVQATSRLTALIALGVAGFGVALIFALFSAPDLAITQILVETLTVVLFAWVVYKLPALTIRSNKRTIIFDAVVSGVAGMLVMLLVIKSNFLSHAESISTTLADWSLEKAYGANVVNVILVDFRALDTLGEIGVLAIAAIGVYALLKPRRKADDSSAS